MTLQERATYQARVSSVFRPGSPIDRSDLFAGRQSQMSMVIDGVMQPGQHVVIFGERGVGKTSLAKILAEVLTAAGFKILNSGTINCDGTDSFASLWRKVFRELSIVIKKRGIGFLAQDDDVSVSLNGVLSDSATPDDIRHYLSNFNHRTIIILDEVDRITDTQTTTLLADTIKSLSDHAIDVTIVLIGVADSVDGLLTQHASIERALVQVPMPRMSPKELFQILDKGFSGSGQVTQAA